jgi:hypothetical protein
MRSKLFKDKAKRLKTSTGRWVQILPDEGEGHWLYDGIDGGELGRILVDQDNNWIYDGRIMTIAEQEEVAGEITGNQKEMEDLFSGLCQ